MKMTKRFKQLSALPLLSALTSPVAHAHPGHLANESAHSLIHIEHIIALVAASVIVYTVFALRNK